MLAVVSIPLGVVLGWVCGGAIRGIGASQVKHEWLILAMFVVQGILRGRLAGTTPGTLGLMAWAASSMVLVFVLVLQRQIMGLALVAVGTSLNLLVVLLNQGMPVVIPPGEVASGVGAASAGFYHLAHQGTYAVWLGDVLPVHLAGGVYALSLGDMLMSVGVVVYLVSEMLRTAGASDAGRIGWGADPAPESTSLHRARIESKLTNIS